MTTPPATGNGAPAGLPDEATLSRLAGEFFRALPGAAGPVPTGPTGLNGSGPVYDGAVPHGSGLNGSAPGLDTAEAPFEVFAPLARLSHDGCINHPSITHGRGRYGGMNHPFGKHADTNSELPPCR